MTKTIKALAVLGVVAGLGVAALPIAGASAKTVIDGTAPAEGAVEGATYDGTADGKVQDTTDLSLEIDELLQISVDNNAVALTSTDNTNYTGDKKVTVNVITRNLKGFDLKIAGTGATNKTSLTNADGVQIIATEATTGALALASDGSSVWGYSIDGTNFAGVTEAGTTIDSSDAPTAAAGEDTEVTFGAVVKDGQAAGVYEGQVTFTASNKQ